ncbi:4201_t:CDS:2, partial [Scutellospora calospora]
PGPWTFLLQSKSWIIWSTVWKNPNTVTLPIISLCSLASSIILQIDPNGIREDRLSITSYKLIIGLRFASLCLFYVMLQFLWIKATREITKFDTHLLPYIRIISNVQRIILHFSILIILISIILKIINQILNLSSTNSQLLNSSIILEIIFVVIINLGYFIFGIIMIWGLAANREVHQRIGETLIYKFVNKGDKWKAGRVVLVMCILMISFSFLTLSDLFFSNSIPTISNFWKSRVTEDLSTFITLFSLIFLLRIRKFSWLLVKPKSLLLTNLKLDKKSGKGVLYSSIDEEDERINSAAYTTRIAVIRPEPTYKMNPNRIDVTGNLQFGNYDIRNDKGEKVINDRNKLLNVDEAIDEKNIIRDNTKLKPSGSSNGNGGKKLESLLPTANEHILKKLEEYKDSTALPNISL